MNLKSFIITFGSFVLTTALLYLIGYVFTIPMFMFHYEYTNNANVFFMTTGSLLPIIFGLVLSFFAERVYLYKQRKKLS